MKIREFLKANFKHFNAAVVVDAADAWVAHLNKGGKMFITLAGAMSTAELGISLAEIIRRGKVHGICSTGANLEEDIFNLVANKHYKRVPNYRNLSDKQEEELRDAGLNRVTDTCIPEEEALRRIEHHLLKLWTKADENGQRYFPYEYFYQLLRSGVLAGSYQIDPKDSWVLAACEKNLPIFTPGWEDSTMGNIFVSNVIKGNIKSFNIIKSGLEQMNMLIDWYLDNSKDQSIGFFQIGGGIAGDFPICVVPLIQQDLQKPCKFWGYFCQISDSTTSYGSYSGAVPNEKITWGKLGIDTPRFIIESDATIVAPLIFQYILEH
ncbi:MAG: deoxyhypusine synthase family protein [candidate division Zixibacteria bacterium]|jgi:deoxyhypusine synthase|nr:deoxyhypusine synthase family protein [candidate division Zixibacteria bacterium]